jgi:hypothetical protein
MDPHIISARETSPSFRLWVQLYRKLAGNKWRHGSSAVCACNSLHELHMSGYCLTGKFVPVLNWVPCHEDVLERGGIAPRILNLGTRCRWVVSFTPRPLYPRYPLVPRASEHVTSRIIRNVTCYIHSTGSPSRDGRRKTVDGELVRLRVPDKVHWHWKHLVTEAVM